MENIILIADHFDTDISSIDFAQMINPKEWATLSANPTFSVLDTQIINWLKEFAPTTYEIAVASSGRKAHDQILINAIKAKVLFEQLDYVGLRSLQHTRFFNLFAPIFENTYKYLIKEYKKHDVLNENVKYLSIVRRENIDPDNIANRYGYSDLTEEKLNEILEKQPESRYLQLCKNVLVEAKLLDGIRRSIEEINFEPKDRSDFQTCACCFRWVRLQPSDRTRIAYHGYTLSRYSYNDVVNSSCLGADFAPFQVSADGTIHLLQVLRDQINKANEALSTLDKNDLDRENQKKISSLKSRISNNQYQIKNALSRIEISHPDRLAEAQAI
ncbi:hypothetical protein ACQWTT_001114 [Acinetobacter baumannii]